MSTNLPALQRTVLDIVEEHDEKVAQAEDAVKAFRLAINTAKMASSVGGQYGGSLWSHGDPTIDAREIRKFLRISGWKAIYDRLSIKRLASAEDRRLFEQTLRDPPELTFETARATFMKYLEAPRFHILRGLAECFTKLDPAYKSHSKVKIGVKGLPKRIILSSWGGYSSWGRERLQDVLNALRAVRGMEPIEHRVMEDFIAYWQHRDNAQEWSDTAKYSSSSYVTREGILYSCYGIPREGAFEVHQGHDTGWGRWRPIHASEPGVELRIFSETCHVIFDPDTLLLINRALAEFYGEVLPDAEDDEPKAKRPGTGVAKDLQYYPTPQAVIETVLYELGIYTEEQVSRYSERPVLRVLEPSCGDGRILDEVRKRGNRVYGIEVHAGRAAEARAKGHPVHTANFLETVPTGDFDRVVMNPPFYGQHWRKHLTHALGFLKPGGQLACILPATAHYDHAVEKEFGGVWHDLPVASFAESGTNVPTGFLIIRKPSNR